MERIAYAIEETLPSLRTPVDDTDPAGTAILFAFPCAKAANHHRRFVRMCAHVKKTNKSQNNTQELLEMPLSGSMGTGCGSSKAGIGSEDAELLLAFASSPLPDKNGISAKTLTPSLSLRKETGQPNIDKTSMVSPNESESYSVSPATAHAPRIKKLAKLKVQIPRKLQGNRPRASISSPFAHHYEENDTATKQRLKPSKKSDATPHCESHMILSSAFVSPKAQEKTSYSTYQTKTNGSQLKLHIPGTGKCRSDHLASLLKSSSSSNNQNRVGEMLVAAAAVQSRNGTMVFHDHLNGEMDTENNVISAQKLRPSLKSYRTSTSAEEKGSPRFVAPQNKRKRCLNYESPLLQILDKAMEDKCLSISCKKRVGKVRNLSSKRARFAEPVVSGYHSPSIYGQARNDKNGQEQEERRSVASSEDRPATLQDLLNQNVPRSMTLSPESSMPSHPAPLSPITVSKEPALRECLRNLFALFWDALFPILQRHGWSYANATPASFECFAVPGITAAERPLALLRSIFEVIQFVKSHGISGTLPSPPSASSMPNSGSSTDRDNKRDEKTAGELADVLLKQRRTIAAMRYNLLRRDLELQQQRILFEQKVILQGQEKKADSHSVCVRKSGKKDILLLRPGPSQGSALGLQMPILNIPHANGTNNLSKILQRSNTSTKTERGGTMKGSTQKATSQKVKRSMYF